MRIRLIKAKHWLLLAVMTLIGIASSCSKEVDMYGCPPSEYNDSLLNN
jgi:hypothetical protein